MAKQGKRIIGQTISEFDSEFGVLNGGFYWIFYTPFAGAACVCGVWSRHWATRPMHLSAEAASPVCLLTGQTHGWMDDVEINVKWFMERPRRFIASAFGRTREWTIWLCTQLHAFFCCTEKSQYFHADKPHAIQINYQLSPVSWIKQRKFGSILFGRFRKHRNTVQQIVPNTERMAKQKHQMLQSKIACHFPFLSPRLIQ